MIWVDRERCTGCGRCIQVCDIEGAILLAQDKAIIDPAKCTSCERCIAVCPEKAIQNATGAEEPEEIQYVEVYPEQVVQQENMPAKPTVPPKTHNWPAIAGTIASSALGIAATLGEALLDKWLERGGGSSGRSPVSSNRTGQGRGRPYRGQRRGRGRR